MPDVSLIISVIGLCVSLSCGFIFILVALPGAVNELPQFLYRLTHFSSRLLSHNVADKSSDAAESPFGSGDYYLAQARKFRSSGELIRAEENSRLAISAYEQSGDHLGVKRAQVVLGAAITSSGDRFQEAIDIVTGALKTTPNAHLPPSDLGDAYLQQGVCYGRLNQHDRAKQCLQSSAGIWEQAGNTEKLAETEIALGDVYCKENGASRLDEAFSHYNKAIQSIKRVSRFKKKTTDQLIYIAQARYAKARILIEKKNYVFAWLLLLQATLTLNQKRNDYHLEVCTQILGRLYKDWKWYSLSERALFLSFVLNEITRSNRRLETMFHIADLAYRMLRLDRAESLIHKSLSDQALTSQPDQTARLHILQAYVILRQDQREGIQIAVDALSSALRLTQETQNPSLRAEVLGRMDEFFRDNRTHKAEIAARLFQSADQFDDEIRDKLSTWAYR